MTANTKPAFFVLGPLDGQKIDIPNGRTYFETFQSPDLRITKFNPDEDPSVDINRVEYFSVLLAGQNETFELFVPEGTNMDSVIEALIQSYFNPEELEPVNSR